MLLARAASISFSLIYHDEQEENKAKMHIGQQMHVTFGHRSAAENRKEGPRRRKGSFE